MRLDDNEMIRPAIVRSTDISTRFPHLFVRSAVRDPGDGIWTVVFKRRPPALELDVWAPMADGELDQRLIDAGTLRSPMYPGVRFEVSADGKALRARLG